MRIALVPRSAFRPKVNWGEKNWVALVRARPDDTFVILDPAERPPLEVEGRHRGARVYDEPNVIDLTGKTPTAKHALAILRECDACVAVDTGLFHAATALIPTVGIIAGAAGWARMPLAGHFRILQGEAPCYPCAFPGQCERKEGVKHCTSHWTGLRVSETLDEMLGRL